MNLRELTAALAAALDGEPGWQQRKDHQFSHTATGVHIMVYGQELSVVFGPLQGQSWDKALAAKTTYTPTLALESTLEVARALVAARTPRRARQTARDVLLLIALHRGEPANLDISDDPLWSAAGWLDPPAHSTVVRAAVQLHAGGLLLQENRLALTEAGRRQAEELAEDLGLEPATTSREDSADGYVCDGCGRQADYWGEEGRPLCERCQTLAASQAGARS